jgi:hypothetical protein
MLLEVIRDSVWRRRDRPARTQPQHGKSQRLISSHLRVSERNSLCHRGSGNPAAAAQGIPQAHFRENPDSSSLALVRRSRLTHLAANLKSRMIS